MGDWTSGASTIRPCLLHACDRCSTLSFDAYGFTGEDIEDAANSTAPSAHG